MLAVFLMYIILLFSIIGLTFCIESLWLYFIHPKNSPKRSIVIYLEENIAKMQLNEITEELKWKGENKFNKIIIVNKNLDYNEFMNLEEEYKNNNFIFIENTEINNWTP